MEHPVEELLAQPAFGPALGYEDLKGPFAGGVGRESAIRAKQEWRETEGPRRRLVYSRG
jgi:hypothetical protein